MPRIKLQIPESFRFSTEIIPRITDINYGGHLGNDSMLSLIHEARVRFLSNYGFTEMNIGNVGIILTDAIIIFKAECFYGDILIFEVDVSNISNADCDFFYRVTNKNNGKLIAIAKTNIAFFDYKNKKVVKVPKIFIEKFKKD